MKRPYENTPQNSVRFFIGNEVEHTPMHGCTTLFVVGSPAARDIINMLIDSNLAFTYHNKIEHIYLGANKSFNADFDITLVSSLLEEGYYVTLDYPHFYHSLVVDKLGDTYSHSKFVPMISLEMPHINTMNYNTTLKIDDTGFDETNPGVWCHALHDLKSKEAFTPWRMYKGDTAI